MNQDTNFQRLANLSLAALVTLTLLLVYAQPITDTDLWWHIAYGRHLIENQSLIPIHSTFNWSPADDKSIYVAWLAETFLFTIYDLGGTSPLFVLRYSCYLLFVIIVLKGAVDLKIQQNPLIWLIVLLGLLLSQSAKYIKPEMFSFVIFSGMIFVWYRLKNHNSISWKTTYLFPIILTAWANTHGAFIFGGMFLGIMYIGELLNYKLGTFHALDKRTLIHLSIAVVLSAFTMFITPYGLEYPHYLFITLLAESQNLGKPGGLQQIYAFKTIFANSSKHYHYVENLLLCMSILGPLTFYCFRKQGIDFAIVLVNLAAIALFVSISRTTYFYAPIFCLSAFYLLHNTEIDNSHFQKKSFYLLLIILSISISYRAIHTTIYTQADNGWFGFGIADSPIAASDYVSTLPEHLRLGNNYNTGAYLLWDLWPRKVFIDSRYFPFRAWLAEYQDFLSLKNVEPFLKTNPADIWLIPHGTLVQDFFLTSSEWNLVFHGPVAAVFIKIDIEVPRLPKSFETDMQATRNIRKGLLYIEFLTKIGDFQTVKTTLELMSRNSFAGEQKSNIQGAEYYCDGLSAYYNENYVAAAKKLEKSEIVNSLHSVDLLTNTYNQLANKYWLLNDNRRAWEFAQIEYARAPTDLEALYNLGIIERYLYKTNPSFSHLQWRQKLRRAQQLLKSDSPLFHSLAATITAAINDATPNLLTPERFALIQKVKYSRPDKIVRANFK
jgi:hypothetical protein